MIYIRQQGILRLLEWGLTQGLASSQSAKPLSASQVFSNSIRVGQDWIPGAFLLTMHREICFPRKPVTSQAYEQAWSAKVGKMEPLSNDSILIILWRKHFAVD